MVVLHNLTYQEEHALLITFTGMLQKAPLSHKLSVRLHQTVKAI